MQVVETIERILKWQILQIKHSKKTTIKKIDLRVKRNIGENGA